MGDTELVQQILAGNSNAFRFLVVKNQKLVLHIVGRVIQQQEDIEDICQEVFIKVFGMIKNFRGESRLSTWIATIAYNTSLTHLKRKKSREVASIDEKPELIARKKDELLTSHQVENTELREMVKKMIGQLPLNYRTVITLFYLEEFSYKEIGEITGMPEGTIKSYLSRAKEQLKQLLENVVASEKTNIFALYD